MNRACQACKNDKRVTELRDIRGDEEQEGNFIVNFPEFLQIPANQPIEVCVDCLKEFNDGNNNSQPVESQSKERSRNHPEIEVQIENVASESITSVFAAPLSSSLDKNTSAPGSNSPVVVNISLDIEKLKEAGEIEKLIPNNRRMQKNARKILSQTMPAAAKKRRLREMLETINEENVGPSSSSSSQSETVIERPAKTPEEYAQEIVQDLLNRSGRVNLRPSRNNLSQESSRSLASNNSQIMSTSNENRVEAGAFDSPPSIAQRNNAPQPSPGNRRLLYDSNSSSDSDRVRNASFGSNNESIRQNTLRVPSVNQSDNEQPARKSPDNRLVPSASLESDNEPQRRSSSRIASRNPSVASDSGQSARRSADRQRNDGNDHSNLAAPRRINVGAPPSATRNQSYLKLLIGG